MNTSKDSRLYAYLAAICYIVSAIYDFIVRVVVSIQVYEKPSFIAIVSVIICIVFCVALLLRNEEMLLAAMALNALYKLYYLINYFCVANIIYFAASVLLLAIAFSVLKGKYNLPRFWYLPAVLYMISFFISAFKSHYISFEWFLIEDIIPAAAYALVGLWLKAADHSPVPKPVNSAPAASSSCPSQAEVIERLKEYKSLLDCGVITEEEFQEKKKEILGL